MRESIDDATEGPPATEPLGSKRRSSVSRRPTLVGGIVLGFAILFGGGAGYLLAHAQRSKSSNEVRSETIDRTADLRISVERQTAARRLAVFHDENHSPTLPPSVVLMGFVAPTTFAPPYEAIDAALFDAGGVRIRLSRIQPVGRHEVCTDGESRRFACGLMGRAALQNLLARRDVTCTPLFLAKAKHLDVFEADCRVDDVDLAEHLVRAGFAFPSPLAGENLVQAFDEARAEGAGVWRGSFVVPDRDPTPEDAHEVEVGSFRLTPTSDRLPEATTAGAPDGRPTAGALPAAGEVTAKRRDGRLPRHAPLPVIKPTRDTSHGPAEPASGRDVGGPPPTAASAPSNVRVIAGPILPPPEALAKKLGSGPSTAGPDPSEYGRGTSDR